MHLVYTGSDPGVFSRWCSPLRRRAVFYKAKRPALFSQCRAFMNELKLTDKPGSVVDSHSSRPAIAHWLKQPTRVQYGPYLVNPYLALLRVEFTVPRTVASRAVRSYRTLSPLPDPACAGHRRFALCCTGRGFPPQALPGTLPYGARTFLPFARLPPKEDDDEAATVWSASARSIEGLRGNVTLRATSLFTAC